MKYLLSAFIFLYFLNTATAQEVRNFLQLGVSPNAYRGDLQDTYDKWSASFHAGVRFNKKKRLNGGFLLSIGNVTGQNLNPDFKIGEDTNIQPNTFFRSSIITAQYDLHINIVKNETWIVFLSQGLGLMRYNPKDGQNNALMDMNNTRAQNEAYSNISFMLPTQLGVNYLLKNNYGFGLQAGFLNTITDYLDNISELGNRKGNDNVLMIRFSLFVPIAYH